MGKIAAYDVNHKPVRLTAVQVQLSPAQIAALDEWGVKAGMTSRSKAARKLITDSLAALTKDARK